MMASVELYIPPNGLRFRLLAYYSGRIVQTRKDWVICSDVDSISSDQGWFTLVPAEGGFHYIQSTLKHDDECVLSTTRNEKDHCRASPITEQEKTHMQFRFEPGTDRYKGCFRLISRYDVVLASLCPKEEASVAENDSTRMLHLQWDKLGKNAEQYFSFVFEDTEIVNVEFDTSAGKILSTKPKVISTTVANDTSEKAKSTADLRREIAVKGTFEHSHGFALGVKATVRAGMPFIESGEIETEATTEHQWTVGEENSWSTTIGTALEIKVPPNSVRKFTGHFKSSTMTVPAKVYSRSKVTGATAVTEVEYRGTSVWDFSYTIQ